MRGAAVARWEAFGGDDEGGGVGAEVEEELAEGVKGEEGGGVEGVEGYAEYQEDYGEAGEAHYLNRLAPEPVHGKYCKPVPR